MAHGTVKFFKPDKGWGAITSPDLPDGFDAWVHFSAIEMDGYRSLNAGDPVEFDYEPVEQDSFPVRRDPRPEALANTLHGIVPASQHRDRLRLAHSPARASAHARACRFSPEQSKASGSVAPH